MDGAISGDDDLVIRTELVGGVGKYGRLLGWLYIGDSALSLNEQMIEEGYAWAYDGGTKQKDFEELREIRRAHGTLTEGTEPHEYDEEWCCQVELGIHDVKSLYNVICYAGNMARCSRTSCRGTRIPETHEAATVFDAC